MSVYMLSRENESPKDYELERRLKRTVINSRKWEKPHIESICQECFWRYCIRKKDPQSEQTVPKIRLDFEAVLGAIEPR
jgi:hypothetical protein